MTTEECLYPQNARSTAYRKGCRCSVCQAAQAERTRRNYEKHRESVLAYHRWYRSQNRETVMEYNRRYHREHTEEAQLRTRERKERMDRLVDSKATKNGSRWTEAEDQVILTWRVGIPALAVELGRTYEATKSRSIYCASAAWTPAREWRPCLSSAGCN